MKVALTGHTGFLGSYLKDVLLGQGIEVLGLGRGGDSDWHFDLGSGVNEFPRGNASEGNGRLDLVIHAAGLAHRVPKTEAEKQAFFDINLEGTRQLLRALKDSGNVPKRFVFISTISVYGEPMDAEVCVPPYPGEDDLEQLDLTPYGLSKWKAEQLVQDWCRQEGVEATSIWRLPLIVGENAPGNLGAMEKAIRKGYYFRIGNSYARMRYFVRIEELATRVLALLDGKGSASGTYNVISGEKSYGVFEDEIASKYGKKVRSIPLWMVRLAAKVGDVLPTFPLNSYRLKKLLGE
jgi:nucleoside-diphosphate-sugar epimerase